MRSVMDELTFALPRPRTVIKPDPKPLASITGRAVMVTGAGGSIGSELALQIAAMKPRHLILADQSELGLYEVDRRLIEGGCDPAILFPALLDVRHEWAVQRLFEKVPPDIVFHAAALKHVPLLENDHNMVEAVRTNVLGSWNIAEACQRCKAQMVLVSTDKAVNPISVMGVTKRVAEIVVTHVATTYPGKMPLGIVRFGNVFGSSGSVVPLFIKQIQQGGPVTITDPAMTRYFMTINDAVGLVLAAGDRLSKASWQEWLYVLDMGRPVRIIELAEQLIEMSGLRVKDVGIEITGLRPGEKLAEELSYPWEKMISLVDGISGARLCAVSPHCASTIRNLKTAAAKQDATGLRALMALLAADSSRDGSHDA
jgi:FlaA1/EpsC-like NDP-sugar epimerase